MWIHISGRRIGPKADTMRFYAVFTGMSEDAILFRSIANDTAERVYVIDKESYELIYTSESTLQMNLYNKYFSRSGSQMHLNSKEREYIQEHPVLKVLVHDGFGLGQRDALSLLFPQGDRPGLVLG